MTAILLGILATSVTILVRSRFVPAVQPRDEVLARRSDARAS